MSSTHAYYKLQLPRDAPFKLKPSPGKGWGVFATKRINGGALILREKPLFIIRKPHEQITESDVLLAFQQLSFPKKQRFLSLLDNGSHPFATVSHALAENSFALPAGTKPCNSQPGHGIFVLHSRLNHSCVPNARVPVTFADSDGETIASFASRDIEAGEEITICYCPGFEFRTRQERHVELGFECHCKACQVGTAFQQLSDLRRVFLRGLQYLNVGVGVDGQRDDSTSPIIADPRLRRKAEEFDIPISTRLVYNILGSFLLEEEGLLDNSMVERIYPAILQLSTSFETESNARIARLAIAQKNWLEKTRLAFTIYGRADAADDAICRELRM